MAEQFADWVYEDVLPTIRKHGFFGALPAKDYIAVVKQFSQLTNQLTDTKNAFPHQLLIKPLRNLCNMAGHPMPDIKLISKQGIKTTINRTSCRSGMLFMPDIKNTSSQRHINMFAQRVGRSF